MSIITEEKTKKRKGIEKILSIKSYPNNMKLKRTLYKYQFELGILLLIVGIFLLILGLFHVFSSIQRPPGIKYIVETAGSWNWWLLVLGIFLTFVFSLFLFDRYRKLKEFKEYIDTESKRKFRKNLPRIEELALALGPSYEDKVVEKEDEYNIDR